MLEKRPNASRSEKPPSAGRPSECSRHLAAGGVVDVLPNLEPTSDESGVRQAPSDVLFDAAVERNAYGTETTFTLPEQVRGPGPRPRTTGPRDAGAPAWWWADAERIVLALVDDCHGVTSDDLHQRFPDEPSASGAAFGGLFARLAHAGLLVEVGMVKSRRPEARRRRIVLWGRP